MFQVRSNFPVVYGPCPCSPEWPGRALVYCDVLRTRMTEDTWRRCRRGDPDLRAELVGRRDRILAKRNGHKQSKAAGMVRRWHAAGKPKRSQEEIHAIYYGQCVECPYFTPRGACGIYWCLLETPKEALLNKIMMATEHCPEGKW